MNLSIVLLFLSFAGVHCKVKLSDLVSICDLNDPKLDDCTRDAAQKLLPHLRTGVKDLHLIPVDPLNVPTLDFGQDTGPISLVLKFNKAKIYGTSSAIVKKIKIDKNDYSFVGDFLFPRFELSGDYVGKGKVLILPLDGSGFGNITTTDMDVHIEFNCKRLFKKKVEYLTIDKLNLSFKFNKSYISFTNLLGGSKELSEATNKFLNENTQEIVEAMRGTLQAVFAELNKQLMNNVFNNVPLREAFKM